MRKEIIGDATLYKSDCLDVLPTLELVDSVVTDPPYGLKFMGRDWDHGVPGIKYWEAVMAAMKPGAHLLAFGGTRTYHRLTCAIEDAGFEIRDCIMWVYGSGFPKSTNISKNIDKQVGRIGISIEKLKLELIKLFDQSGKTRNQIDKECGFRASNYLTLDKNGKRPDPWINILPASDKWDKIKEVIGCGDEIDSFFVEAEREILEIKTKARSKGQKSALPTMGSETEYIDIEVTASSSPEAQEWDGWGTALKPAVEPIVWATKPLTVVPLDSKLMAESQNLIGGLLCQLLSHVNNAEKVSKLSQRVSGGVSVSALMIAAVLHGNKSGELYEVTDMCSSREVASTCLNIALLWNSILGELYKEKNTFTISIISNLTTALKTLKYCILPIMHDHTIKAVSLPVGSELSVTNVVKSSSDEKKNLRDTQTAFAAVLASLPIKENSTNAKNANENLLPTIQSVASVLNHVLECLTTGSGERINPSFSPIIVARKPFKGTVAANVLEHGTGGLNIDACRVPLNGEKPPEGSAKRVFVNNEYTEDKIYGDNKTTSKLGRFPANLIHDGSNEVVELFPDSKGGSGNGNAEVGTSSAGAITPMNRGTMVMRNDKGSASRFFYCAKTSKSDRGEANKHPTVKPTSLMQYLCRLVTPPGGTILDPYMGSGSTGKAALKEGFKFIGIDNDEEENSFETACRRIEQIQRQGDLFRPKLKQESMDLL